MAKKHKSSHATVFSPAVLKERVDRAVREDRYQQALDLAKQLYKHEPTPAHQELLHKVYLGRARQLRLRGYLKDARTVLDNALQLADNNPARLEEVLTELAACGDIKRTQELLQRIPNSALQGKITAQAVDAALQEGTAGRRHLPENLQGQFDLIVRAFTQLEAGQDEQVRETLQGIGIQSPFLEWKLLVRGFQAYYQNEDERALENWQRLDAQRIPAKLAAPFRFRIDANYRLAQPPPTQVALQKLGDQLQSSGLVQSLRTLQTSLAGENLAPSFRLAEGLLPTMRREAPHLVPRLAACFYWAIISGGQPRDVDRYRRLFGPPSDDPQFERLEALVMEQMAQMQDAHEHWRKYEQAIAANASSWPGEQANRARALVWWHMGNNAASVPDTDKIKNLPPFLRNHPSRPKPLKPTAEQCFQEALKLAPDLLMAHEALFHYYQREKELAKAEEAAKKLLERFPEHLPTLEALGRLCMQRQKYGAGLRYYQRALKANPLDRRLRSEVSTAHLFHARSLVEAGRFDEARAEYQSSIANDPSQDRYSALCKWAACEFKAGETARAEELLQQALTHAGSQLAVAFSMLIECIRLKLPRPLKSRFDKEFKEKLEETATAPAAVALAETASAHRAAGIKYYGQKTHEKKVLTYLDKSRKLDWTENQLEKICSSLLALKALKPLREFATRGKKLFPKAPYFPYIEAESYLAQGANRSQPWRVQPLLEKARQLAEALPRDDKQRELLENIEKHQEMLGTFNPFFRGGPMDLFGSIFDQMDDEEYEDEDDEEGFW